MKTLYIVIPPGTIFPKSDEDMRRAATQEAKLREAIAWLGPKYCCYKPIRKES